jgi:hypothetical protein
MTGSSLAGILTAGATLVTAGSLWFAAMPAFSKMRREAREDRLQAAEERTQIQAQLGVIHTLTNATLSAAYEATLESAKRELVMMREVGRLNLEAGRELSPTWRAAVDGLERRVADLTLNIQERQTQTMAANIQIADEKRRADKRVLSDPPDSQ